ncbi:unnamed protein product [Blepharisma stoltei]|uniref:TLDc domain-containing protein n=1 Tax=Blepharisma stoltei TaxID=1481888 RepID=A0AAU9IRA7_9CILI|nr:unnamed protein product [Blepharisma stoltei]
MKNRSNKIISRDPVSNKYYEDSNNFVNIEKFIRCEADSLILPEYQAEEPKHRPSLSFNHNDFSKIKPVHKRTVSEVLPHPPETEIITNKTPPKSNYHEKRLTPNSLAKYLNQTGLPILKERNESSSSDSMSEDEKNIRNIISERKSWNLPTNEAEIQEQDPRNEITSMHENLVKKIEITRMDIKKKLLMIFGEKDNGLPLRDARLTERSDDGVRESLNTNTTQTGPGSSIAFTEMAVEQSENAKFDPFRSQDSFQGNVEKIKLALTKNFFTKPHQIATRQGIFDLIERSGKKICVLVFNRRNDLLGIYYKDDSTNYLHRISGVNGSKYLIPPGDIVSYFLFDPVNNCFTPGSLISYDAVSLVP